jgi:hypothetical protein
MVDLSNIVFISLVAQSNTCLLWVLDVSASANKFANQPKLDLPLISVQSATVSEGTGVHNVHMNITTSKALQSPGAIWCRNMSGWESFKIRIPAGKSGVVAKIPFSIEGENDGLYSPPNVMDAILGAMRGVSIGEFYGGLEIVDVNPAPTISVSKKEIVTVEGSTLEWTFTLSSGTIGFSIECVVVAPSTGTELDSGDVTKNWLKAYSDWIPPIPTPLSQLYFSNIGPFFSYGSRTEKLVIPIRNDTVQENDKIVILKCSSYTIPWKATLTGKVLAN